MMSIADHPLILKLAKLEMDRDDFVIFGSGPLLVHGLRRDVGDLDVVARDDSWRWACKFGDPVDGSGVRVPIVHFCLGKIEVSPEWLPHPRWDTDELIDRAEIKDGFRFARLDDVLRYKRTLLRPKDLKDILAIEARWDIQA